MEEPTPEMSASERECLKTFSLSEKSDLQVIRACKGKVACRERVLDFEDLEKIHAGFPIFTEHCLKAHSRSDPKMIFKYSTLAERIRTPDLKSHGDSFNKSSQPTMFSITFGISCPPLGSELEIQRMDTHLCGSINQCLSF